MYLLHSIGERTHSNKNTLEEILASTGPISFDGIYKSVFNNMDALKGKDVTLFVIGSTVGKDNAFDAPNYHHLEEFCNWDEIFQLKDYLKARIGWHTKTHRPLDGLSRAELFEELTPPFPMDCLAYPGGIYTPLVEQVAKELGYKEGYTVSQGDGSAFQKRRNYLNW